MGVITVVVDAVVVVVALIGVVVVGVVMVGFHLPCFFEFLPFLISDGLYWKTAKRN